MAKQPASIEIRSYQVGFGDCFLLSFVYGKKDTRHVLIDFGTTGLPNNGKPSEHMKRVADEIATVVGKGNRLTAVIATHRHADHISGFATDGKTGQSGVVIRNLKPKLVLQPWTEDPAAAKNAQSATPTAAGKRGGKSLVSALASMNDLSARVQRLAESKPAWMSVAMQRELSFLGAENIANRSAIDNLIAMGTADGAKAKYLRHGDKSGLETLLPGVKVHVLGPPDLTQTKKITKQKSSDPNEFWQLVANAVPAVTSLDAGVQGGPGGKGRKAAAGVVPPDARWFCDKLQALSGQSMLEIVRQLDQQMNNTSLILLFEVFGKKLLFPGDAQIENWSYALVDSPDAKKTAALLADVDFYKVGHHGSRNATPRKLLWENFRKRKGRQLKTMMSTMPGKHGAKKSKTEVPRETLLTALKAESQLLNTDDLPKSELANVEIIKP